MNDPEIEKFRDTMPPEVFEAFAAHAGIIDGSPDLDVVKLTRVPD
jgi:hypothetical protein